MVENGRETLEEKAKETKREFSPWLPSISTTTMETENANRSSMVFLSFKQCLFSF